MAIVTVSTSRSLDEDKSGQWMNRQARKEGHTVVARQLVPDDTYAISRTVKDIVNGQSPDLLLVSGGTGLTASDVTIEAVKPLFKKEITAFPILFAQLSFEEIDSAALLSRATAGVIEKSAVFCLPGSLNACKLACKVLIFPEAAHIAGHIQA